MKKTTLLILCSLLVVGFTVILVSNKASAGSCTTAGSCTYFTENYAPDIVDNVLQPPALSGVNNKTWLEDTMYKYLFNGNYHQRVGAAFVIDNMLDYKNKVGLPVGGDASPVSLSGPGVSYAVKNWSTWINLVDGYAVNTCSTGTTTANCPGKSFGINWAYKPSKATFCDNGGTLDSGWDTSWNEPAFFHVHKYLNANGIVNATCSYEYNASMPEIHFYWQGGSFDIGSDCGNVQDGANSIPPPDQMPTAKITVACNATQQQVATVKFDDADSPGTTTGYITINGYTSGRVSAGSSHDITIPSTFTDPVNSQNVYLHVRDVGPLAPPNVDAIFKAQTSVPCITYGCAIVQTPVPVDPNMPYQLAVKVTSSGGPVPSGTAVGVKVTAPGGSSRNFGPQTVGGTGNTTVTATFANLAATGGTGQYKIDATVTAASGTTTCSSTFNVLNLPYLNVYGGDVMVGASPAIDNACVVDNNGGAFSWNSYGSGFAGAGTEYAAQTLAQIDEFASAMNPSSSTSPTGLSFANNSIPAANLNTSQGLYGGFFADSSGSWACADYTTGMGSPKNVATTINGHTVNIGTQELQYITGHDVYITGNITYAGTGGWASLKDIPYLKVVVTGGNIYIDSSVTQLDGLFVAEPSGATGGKIITCATNGGGIWKAVDPTQNGFYNTCKQKLVVNGAFVAKQVLFGRTNGTLGQATPGDSLGSNHDAEVFNYTPELWLPRGNAPPSDTYDAITALPPIL